MFTYHYNFRLRDITDGAGNTYLVGEKYMLPDAYMPQKQGDPVDMGSDQSLDHGVDYDAIRWTKYGEEVNGAATYYPPYQDQPGVATFPANNMYGVVSSLFIFGSAHPISMNMVFCDGSVQAIPYTIDPVVHSYLGSRNDGHAVDAKKL